MFASKIFKFNRCGLYMPVFKFAQLAKYIKDLGASLPAQRSSISVTCTVPNHVKGYGIVQY